jgi:hypothetical protein
VDAALGSIQEGVDGALVQRRAEAVRVLDLPGPPARVLDQQAVREGLLGPGEFPLEQPDVAEAGHRRARSLPHDGDRPRPGNEHAHDPAARGAGVHAEHVEWLAAAAFHERLRHLPKVLGDPVCVHRLDLS